MHVASPLLDGQCHLLKGRDKSQVARAEALRVSSKLTPSPLCVCSPSSWHWHLGPEGRRAGARGAGGLQVWSGPHTGAAPARQRPKPLPACWSHDRQTQLLSACPDVSEGSELAPVPTAVYLLGQSLVLPWLRCRAREARAGA